jgi:hypothetical protein
MLYVDNVDQVFVYATIAYRCCDGCLSPHNCGNPYFEMKLHLFLKGQYVPFTKAHVYDSFSVPLHNQSCAFQAIKNWKQTVIRVMNDLVMFPTFLHAGHIWWQLSRIHSPNWNCRCPEVREGLCLEDYCREHPHWARDFVLHHYCGEIFFEEMLEKYLECPCSFKPLAAVFGSDVANRLLMASTIVNPRKKMKSTLSYHDLEMHSAIYSTDEGEDSSAGEGDEDAEGPNNYSDNDSDSDGSDEDFDQDDESNGDGFDTIS